MSCGCGCTPRFQRASFLNWKDKVISQWPFMDPSTLTSSDRFAVVAETTWQPSPGQWAMIYTNAEDFGTPHPDMHGTSGWLDSWTPPRTKFNFARGHFDDDGWHVDSSVTIYDVPFISFEEIGVADCRIVSRIDDNRVLCAVMVKRFYQPWWPGSSNSRYAVNHKLYVAVFNMSTLSFGPRVLAAGSESYSPSFSERFNGVSVTAPALSRRDDADADWDLYWSEEGISSLKSNASLERDEFVSQPRSRVKRLRVSGDVVNIMETTSLSGIDDSGGISEDVVVANLLPVTYVIPGSGETAIQTIITWGTPLLAGEPMPDFSGGVILSQRPWVRYNVEGLDDVLHESTVNMVDRVSGQWRSSYPIVGNLLRPRKLSSRLVSTRGVEVFDENESLEGVHLETFEDRPIEMNRRPEAIFAPSASEPHPYLLGFLRFLDSMQVVVHDEVPYLVSHSPESSMDGGRYAVNAVVSIRELRMVPGLTRVVRPWVVWRSETETSDYLNQVGVLALWGPWKMVDETNVVFALFWRRTSSTAEKYGVFMIKLYERDQEISGRVVRQRIDFENLT